MNHVENHSVSRPVRVVVKFPNLSVSKSIADKDKTTSGLVSFIPELSVLNCVNIKNLNYKEF